MVVLISWILDSTLLKLSSLINAWSSFKVLFFKPSLRRIICLVTGGRYANYKYYLDHGYTIIPYEDFELLDSKKHIVIEIFSQDKWIEILNVEMDFDDQFDEIISHLNSGKPTIINGQNIALVINNTSDNMYKVCKNEYQ